MFNFGKNDKVQVVKGQHAGLTGVIDSFWMPEFCPDNKVVEVRMDDSDAFVSFAFDELKVI